jgi:hypothetical protein
MPTGWLTQLGSSLPRLETHCGPQWAQDPLAGGSLQGWPLARTAPGGVRGGGRGAGSEYALRGHYAHRRARSSIRTTKFVDVVGEILRSTGVPLMDLELEITEGVIMRDVGASLSTLDGVRVSQDSYLSGRL